ncbi:head-tail connector protein [Paralcaligenes ginsengisoli]
MSVIDLTVAKNFLDIIHSADDAKLQVLLDGAEDEAVQFMNRANLIEWDSESSSEDPVPGSVIVGILLLLQATYQATPDDADKLRRAAEVKLMPHRLCLGV